MNFAYELMDLCRGTQEVEAVDDDDDDVKGWVFSGGGSSIERMS